MLLIVKIVSLQYVKGGSQSSSILLSFFSRSSSVSFYSNHHSFGFYGFSMGSLWVLYGFSITLYPLFLSFSKPLILYMQKKTDIQFGRCFLLSLSLDIYLSKTIIFFQSTFSARKSIPLALEVS